jgi:hypothetical protein
MKNESDIFQILCSILATNNSSEQEHHPTVEDSIEIVMNLIEQIDSFGSSDGDSGTEEIPTDCDDLDKSIPIDHDNVSADVTDQVAISIGTASQQRIVARIKGQVSDGQKSKLATCSFPQCPPLIIVDLEGKYDDDELSALLAELTFQYPDGKPDTVHAKTMFLLSELPRPFLF